MTEYKSFWERVQSAPEVQKKRWMIVSVAIVMVIVVYIWLMYFNNLVAGFSATATGDTVAQAPAPEGGSGGVTMISTFTDGLANLYQVFIGKMRGLGDILQSPREYIVNPPK